ncbi:MAG: hypothetical protein Q4B85_04545 [Lachnospiraceae bacterium]|nr:hypothetical protein [Lachnospiraceae bacterium]
MKKTVITAFVLSLALGLSACGGKTPSSSDNSSSQEIVAGDTMGSKYLAEFANSDKETAADCVKELLDLKASEAELVEMEVEEGYLPGFDEEISGFTTGVQFAPMIGTIPFVGYVFESEDPEALLKSLKDTANPAWNICTEAEETVSYVRGNLVFFLMCPGE